MTDREQADKAKPGMEQKPQRDFTGKVGESHGGSDDRAKASRPGVKPGGTVGREVPDESKEHHTEIAIEAGHNREHRGNKR